MGSTCRIFSRRATENHRLRAHVRAPPYANPIGAKTLHSEFSTPALDLGFRTEKLIAETRKRYFSLRVLCYEGMGRVGMHGVGGAYDYEYGMPVSESDEDSWF